MSIYNYISALQPSTVEWQYSLRDLEFANVDALPQTPPCSAKVPQILTSVCREGDTDVCKELYVQGIDTAQNSIPSKVTAGQNLRTHNKILNRTTRMDTDAQMRGVSVLLGTMIPKVISKTPFMKG